MNAAIHCVMAQSPLAPELCIAHVPELPHWSSNMAASFIDHSSEIWNFRCDRPLIRCPCSNEKGDAMRKTLMALAAVATLAFRPGGARACPRATRCWRGVAGGLIGGAIVGGAIASQNPATTTVPAITDPATAITAPGLCRRPRYYATAATGSASASGMAMAGAFAASGFAAKSRSSSLNQTALPENRLVSGDACQYYGLKKPFFRPTVLQRLLWIDCCALS